MKAINKKKSRGASLKSGAFLLLIVIGLSTFDLSVSSCASKSSPDGGPRDTIAPQLDTSYPPNKSLYFNYDRIILEFDEYLNLKSPQQQINISPLLAEDLEIIARGRKVEILLKDSLRENTTYIISFGSSLTDLNEGNENKNFKYVFSTGSFLDSLRLSGTLKDAYTNEPVSNYLVGLYDVRKMQSRDSFLLKTRPDYYAFTDETGSFGMSYLRSGEFFMAAFEDKAGTFKLPKSTAPIAFWSDTISMVPDSLYRFDLVRSEPQPNLRFLGARQKSAERIQFAFNLPAEEFKIEDINGKPDSAFQMWNAKKDTLNYYFSFKADSLNFKINYDSIFVDSVITVRLRKMDEPKLKLNLKVNKVRSRDTVVFRSPARLTRMLEDSIFKFTDKDTSNVILVRDSLDPFQWYLPPPQRKSFRLRFKPGAIAAEGRVLEDSFDLSLEVLKGEDLGTLSFKVSTDSGRAMILQLYNEQEDLILERSFTDSTMVEYKNVIPSLLSAYLIHDADSNGSYTPGDFILYRQPEKRVKYKEDLEIRANWELEIEWRYRTEQAINSESLLNNDSSAVGQ